MAGKGGLMAVKSMAGAGEMCELSTRGHIEGWLQAGGVQSGHTLPGAPVLRQIRGACSH